MIGQPGTKAANRRQRVAIFGGSKNEKQGRRHQAGKVFNRRQAQGAANAAAGGPRYTGADGADLGLNEGVEPEGNLYHTWTPRKDMYGNLVGPTQTSDAGGGPEYQIGTLSTGAEGYYDPATGRFIYYDFGSDNDDD